MRSIYEYLNKDNNYEIIEYNSNNINKDIKNQIKDINDIPQPKESEITNIFIIKQKKNKKFDGIIIVNLNPREEYNLFSLNKKELGHDIEILFFYVYKEYQNTGLGSSLLKYVLNKYKKYYIGLGTGSRTTESAKKLYKKFGFEIVVTVKNSPFNWWLRKPTSKDLE